MNKLRATGRTLRGETRLNPVFETGKFLENGNEWRTLEDVVASWPAESAAAEAQRLSKLGKVYKRRAYRRGLNGFGDGLDAGRLDMLVDALRKKGSGDFDWSEWAANRAALGH